MAKFVRKIIKSGNDSFYVNIPKEIIAKLKLRERQSVSVQLSGPRIVVSTAVPKKKKAR